MKKPVRNEYARGASGARKFAKAMAKYRKTMNRQTKVPDSRPVNRRGRRINVPPARRGMSNIPTAGATGGAAEKALGYGLFKNTVKLATQQEPSSSSNTRNPKPAKVNETKENPYTKVTRSTATDTTVDPKVSSNPPLMSQTKGKPLTSRQKMLNRKYDRLQKDAKRPGASARDKMRARIARRYTNKK
tara:strand:- start:67 stop:630 length:564 start_codon:yes stop_codon:yes gene_type:complete